MSDKQHKTAKQHQLNIPVLDRLPHHQNTSFENYLLRQKNVERETY
jgi:hypothetical protein